MKFLNLENETDTDVWFEVIKQGHDAKLHPCSYGQDFKASMKCTHYEPCGDAHGGNGLSECAFALFTCETARCELQPITKEDA